MAVQLDTIGIVVTDMGKSLAFYRLAGLTIPEGQDEESNVEVRTDSGVTLGFLTEATAKQAEPRWQTPVGQRMNLQFQCGSPAEVDTTHARLIEAGYSSYTDPWDAYWGQRFARVQDPDGNIVNFFSEL